MTDSDADQRKVIEQSEITCPLCSYKKLEQMPLNACQYYYDCKGCGELLKPNAGDCCVFCSFGTVKCPPVQSGNNCCAIET